MGAGSARAGGLSSKIEMLGTEGVGSLIGGMDETSIEGTQTLMVGTVGASSMCSAGGSGTLIVGTTGAEAVDIKSWGFGRSDVGTVLEPSWIEGPIVDEFSCFGPVSLGLQSLSKLTIGLPGRSLTTVGDGNFGLLSFIRMLVAALISSLRISMPFLILGLSALASSRPAISILGGQVVDLFAK